MSSRSGVVAGSIPRKGHFAQNVPLGENARDTELAVHYRDGSHVVIQHLVNSVGDAGIERNCGDISVTKLKYAHAYLLSLPVLQPKS